MVSSVHRGFNSSRAVFFSCINSPSTRLAITVANNSITSAFRSLASATEARPSKKSPARTAILLPKNILAEGEDLRVVELSITSSCNKDAVCISSVISARRRWEGRTSEFALASMDWSEESSRGYKSMEDGLRSDNIIDGEIESSTEALVEAREPLDALESNEVARDISRTISGRMCLPSELV